MPKRACTTSHYQKRALRSQAHRITRQPGVISSPMFSTLLANATDSGSLPEDFAALRKMVSFLPAEFLPSYQCTPQDGLYTMWLKILGFSPEEQAELSAHVLDLPIDDLQESQVPKWPRSVIRPVYYTALYISAVTTDVDSDVIDLFKGSGLCLRRCCSEDNEMRKSGILRLTALVVSSMGRTHREPAPSEMHAYWERIEEVEFELEAEIEVLIQERDSLQAQLEREQRFRLLEQEAEQRRGRSKRADEEGSDIVHELELALEKSQAANAEIEAQANKTELRATQRAASLAKRDKWIKHLERQLEESQIQADENAVTLSKAGERTQQAEEQVENVTRDMETASLKYRLELGELKKKLRNSVDTIAARDTELQEHEQAFAALQETVECLHIELEKEKAVSLQFSANLIMNQHTYTADDTQPLRSPTLGGDSPSAAKAKLAGLTFYFEQTIVEERERRAQSEERVAALYGEVASSFFSILRKSHSSYRRCILSDNYTKSTSSGTILTDQAGRLAIHRNLQNEKNMLSAAAQKSQTKSRDLTYSATLQYHRMIEAWVDRQKALENESTTQLSNLQEKNDTLLRHNLSLTEHGTRTDRIVAAMRNALVRSERGVTRSRKGEMNDFPPCMAFDLPTPKVAPSKMASLAGVIMKSWMPASFKSRTVQAEDLTDILSLQDEVREFIHHFRAETSRWREEEEDLKQQLSTEKRKHQKYKTMYVTLEHRFNGIPEWLREQPESVLALSMVHAHGARMAVCGDLTSRPSDTVDL
ncbi:hypothetical protein FB45DRAFT_863397 [Roridomyces roridus]|uniref:Uncharacterized protein n=1 Tax=Roridomyces roridus TaxID=1738132 RepID=A0AAD7FU50_9AGAR|nr:hypothetical protein FB45DRAFT_863397 [Roridomyces roridus]